MANEADHMADERDAVVDYRGFARIMSNAENESRSRDEDEGHHNQGQIVHGECS
jgi:hypothetical protein